MKKYLTNMIKDKLFLIGVICLTIVSLIVVINLNKESKSSEATPKSIKAIDESVIIKEEVNIEINSKTPEVSSFFENIPNEDLTITYYQDEKEVELKTDVVTSYDVIISGNKNYRSKLNIVDTTAPEVELKNVTIFENNSYLPQDFISLYKDNSGSDKYTIEFVNSDQANLKKVGTYDISLKICDINQVCTEKNTTLKINKSSTSTSEKKDSNKASTTASNNSSSNEVKVVKETTEKVIIKSKDIKYGVKEVTTAKITYDVYSNGTKKEVNRQDIKTKYDYSGYNGTINSMKPEATNLYNSLSSTRNTILTETNKYRSEEGLTGLKIDKNLSILATIRAMEMAYGNKFSHTRPNGKSWDTFWEESGFNFTVPAGGTYGENLAYGYSDDLGACNGWYNSEGHYENMVNKAYTKIGIGKYTFNNKTYWVQFFSS